MAVAKQWGEDLLSPDELMDGLEEIRASYGGMGRNRKRPETIEAIAESKRRGHRGGDGNHRFEGERYLNIDSNREARRFQLRKLVDEGGQDSVGGPLPSHPTLKKWHSVEFGLTDAEGKFILKLSDSQTEGAVVGNHTVTLADKLSEDPQGSDAGGIGTTPRSRIPMKYVRNPPKFEVKSGTANEAKIELTSK